MAALVVILLYPRYDLEISSDLSWDNHWMVEIDFYTLSACREAASKHNPADYVCLKKTLWGQLTNSHSKYDSKHR